MVYVKQKLQSLESASSSLMPLATMDFHDIRLHDNGKVENSIFLAHTLITFKKRRIDFAAVSFKCQYSGCSQVAFFEKHFIQMSNEYQMIHLNYPLRTVHVEFSVCLDSRRQVWVEEFPGKAEQS